MCTCVTNSHGQKFTFLNQSMTGISSNELNSDLTLTDWGRFHAHVTAWAHSKTYKCEKVHMGRHRKRNQAKRGKGKKWTRSDGETEEKGKCEGGGKDAGQAEVRAESLLSSWMVLCTIQSIQPSPLLIISVSCPPLWNTSHHEVSKTSCTDEHLRRHSRT